MADKGKCRACERKIQDTVFDKCMYCGEPLATNQKFTDEEKNNIKLNQQKRNQRAKDTTTGMENFTDISNNFDFSD